MAVTMTLAFYDTTTITTVKSFVLQAPGLDYFPIKNTLAYQTAVSVIYKKVLTC